MNNSIDNKKCLSAISKQSKVLDVLLNIKSDRIKPRKYIFHTSNPLNREFISRKWLVARKKSEAWLEDTHIKWKALFFSNTEDWEKFFDSWYDDDLYKIFTSNLDLDFFYDPNFWNNESLIYCKWNIWKENIELVYRWNWENCDDWPELSRRIKENNIKIN